MKRSGYLERRTRDEKATLDEMRRTISQYMFDTFCIALHRRHGFGYKRLKELEQDWSELYDYYWPALQSTQESDVFQERMDREILSWMPEDVPFYPFAERYPAIKRLGYEPKRRKR